MSEPKRQTKLLCEASWDLLRAVVRVLAAEQNIGPKRWTLIIDDGVDAHCYTDGTFQEQLAMARVVVKEMERRMTMDVDS